MSQLQEELRTIKEDNEVLMSTKNSINEARIIMRKDMVGLEEQLKQIKEKARVSDACTVALHEQLKDLQSQLLYKCKKSKELKDQLKKLNEMSNVLDCSVSRLNN